MNNVFHDRATSGFALSLSTGLAMETLFIPRAEVKDPGRLAPPRMSVQKYETLWINVLTLIRNIFTSVETAKLSSVTVPMLVEIVHQEIDLIKDLLRIEGNNTCKPVFYFASYPHALKGLSDIFKLRFDKTPIQKQTRFIYDQTRLVVSREDREIQNFTDGSGFGDRKKALILSHICMDLLHYEQFDHLELLESHTGKIKKRVEWNTKYHKLADPNFERLPFTRHLLYLFGDSSLLTPTSLKIRRDVLELAKSQRWTPMASATRVAMDLRKHFKDEPIAKDLSLIPSY